MGSVLPTAGSECHDSAMRLQSAESLTNEKESFESACPALQRLFEVQVERTPDAEAVCDLSGGSSACNRLTYAQLNARANQLAHFLVEQGAGPDTLVGVCIERSMAMIIAVLAALKAGAAYVPFDPAYPEERLGLMLQDTQAPVVLTQEAIASRLPRGRRQVVCLDRDEASISRLSRENLPTRTGPENLAYVIYTSGSTGRPKGVAMRQGALVNLLTWQNSSWSYPKLARTLQFASLNFDVSFQEIFSTWVSGGTLVLVDEDTRRDSRALLRFIQANRIQRLFLPFIALKHLAEAAATAQVEVQHLREVITAGEQLQITPALVEFFSQLSDCTLENQYGPSETHVVTAYRLTGSPRNWPVLPPIGRPISNSRVLILDESRKPVATNEAGELYLGGSCLARGYLNRAELTAEKFVSDPFALGGESRLYRTGDLGRQLPDGNIEFLGRMDGQVKVAGVRVELGEIEAALHLHPSIKEVAVVARQTEGGDKRLVAYVVAQPGKSVTSTGLREFLKRKLPASLLPSVFSLLESLPLTPNGKVDRRSLPDPTQMDDDPSVVVKQPHTPLEMALQLVFERFLKRRPIGTNTSFFELGGDSLQALNLIIEVERVTGRKLSLGILYQAPTVESLARVIEQQSDHQWSSLVPLQPLGDGPPLFLVHSMPGDVLGYGGVVFHLGTQLPCYGLQSLGLHRPEEAHTRLHEMAAYYVNLIRSHQSHGPYYLGGWCYGGIIAVEMALQLLAAGEKVAFLGLIETPAPAPGWTHLGYYIRRLGCLLQMPHKAMALYLLEKIKYYRGVKQANRLRFRRLEPGEGKSAAEVEASNRYLERLELVYKANDDALRFYRSRYYPGKIVLFNAAEQDPALIRDAQYGWTGLADDIETHVIAGNHATILMEPQAQMLASRISECLREAARKSACS